MVETVAVIDTGVLCCWLEVPGRNTANSGDNLWNNARANDEIDRITNANGTIILPNAVILETARFISQATHSRRVKAEMLLDKALAAHDAVSPWKRFNENERLWTQDWYRDARAQWPELADHRISLTDFALLWIVDYFRRLGSSCDLLTTENALAEKVALINQPLDVNRRRRRP